MGTPSNPKRMSSVTSVPASDPSQLSVGIFKAKYLGSAPISDISRGLSVLSEASAIVKDIGTNPTKVFIMISPTELKVVNRATNDALQTITLDQLALWGVDPADKKHLGYFIKTRVGSFYCHMFQVKEKALDVIHALTAASKERTSKMQQEHKSSLHPSQSAPQLGPRPSQHAPPPHLPTSSSTSTDLQSNNSSSSLSSENYDAFYLGSTIVSSISGSQVVRDALVAVDEQRRRLLTVRKTMGSKKQSTEGDPVTLIVNDEAVRVSERLSGELVMRDPIKNVSFTYVQEQDKKTEVFAYISQDETLGRIQCHIFNLGSGKASSLCEAFNAAFKRNAEAHKNKEVNPFAPLSSNREPAPPSLFRLQVHRADLQSVKPIGAGQYGEVYLAIQSLRNTLPGEPNRVFRAVKLLRSNASALDKEQFVRESEIMLSMQHDNLVSLIGVAIQQAPWLAVLEYMPFGDLRNVLMACQERNMKLTLPEQLSWAHQLACGCAYLSSKNLVHMDLAARNCLLGTANVVKISDFGLTRSFDVGKSYYQLRELLRLPIKWVAIEGLEERKFSEASDVWAFGVVMWEIFMYGEVPYKNIRTVDVHQRVKEGVRLDMPPDCPQRVFMIMSQCWHPNPASRYKFTVIMERLMEIILFIPPTKPRDIGELLHGSPISLPPDTTNDAGRRPSTATRLPGVPPSGPPSGPPLSQPFTRVGSIQPGPRPQNNSNSCPVCRTPFQGLSPPQVTTHLEACRLSNRSIRSAPSGPPLTPSTPTAPLLSQSSIDEAADSEEGPRRLTFVSNRPPSQSQPLSTPPQQGGQDSPNSVPRTLSFGPGEPGTQSYNQLQRNPSVSTPTQGNPPRSQPSIRVGLSCPHCKIKLEGKSRAEVESHVRSCNGTAPNPSPVPPQTTIPIPSPSTPAPPQNYENVSNVMDLEDILRVLGLQQYSVHFESHRLTNRDLPSLDHEMLNDIGIESKLHRARILTEISKRKSLPASSGPSLPLKLSLQNESTPTRHTYLNTDISSSTDDLPSSPHTYQNTNDPNSLLMRAPTLRTSSSSSSLPPNENNQPLMRGSLSIGNNRTPSNSSLLTSSPSPSPLTPSPSSPTPPSITSGPPSSTAPIQRQPSKLSKEVDLKQELKNNIAESNRPPPVSQQTQTNGGVGSLSKDHKSDKSENDALQAAKERAKQLELSSEVKTLTLTPKKGGNMFGDESKRSKIYQALNPQPLAFQTARDRASREEEAIDLGDLEQESLAVNMITSQFVFQSESEEEEEEEEEDDPDDLPDFSGFSEEMKKLKAAREAAHQKHQDELKEKHMAKQRAIQAALDEEMKVINARMEKEKKLKEGNKDDLVKATQNRLGDLSFGQFVFKF